MATYKSPEVTLNSSAENVYSKLSNIENLKTLIDRIPADKMSEEQKSQLSQLEITPDSITFPGGPVGALTLRLTEKTEPSLIRLTGENTPVPLSLTLHIKPETSTESKGFVDIDIEIPALLKPMIGGQIQKMADQFGDMLKAIPF